MIATRHVGDNATFYTSEQAAGGVVGRSPSLTLSDRRAIAAGLMTREQAMESRLRYSSWRAAKKAGKSVGDMKARRTRGTQDLGDRYHDNCRCLAQPIWDRANMKADATMEGRWLTIVPEGGLQ